MKKAYLISLILIFLLSCKRETPLIVAPDPFCSGSAFRKTLNLNFEAVSITEDKDGNIIIAGNDTGEIHIIKLNSDGDLLWHLTNTGIPGIMGELATTDDNSILITTYEENIIHTFYSNLLFDNVYIQGGLFDGECEPWFNIDYTDSSTVEGKSYLTKFDALGNINWTKQFNESYPKGKCLSVEGDNDIYFLTVSLNGRSPEVQWDNWGVFTDTVLYPMDRNILNIHHLDCNGNIIKTIRTDSIFNHYHEISPKIDLAFTKNKVILKTAKEIIVLDRNGVQQYRFLSNSEQCSNLITSMVVNPDGAIIVSEKYNLADWGTVYVHYSRRLNLNGTAVWTSLGEELITDMKGDFYLSVANNTMNVYDINGQPVFSITEAGTNCAMINCNLGITYVISDQGQLTVCRTDNKGNY